MTNQFKTVGFLEDKMTRLTLEEELRLQLSNPAKCEQALKGLKLPALRASQDIVNQVKNFSPAFQFSEGKLLYDKLQIREAILTNNEIGPSQSSGLVEMVFFVRRTREGGGPSVLQPIRLSMNLAVDEGHNIESCSVKSTEAELLEGCGVRGAFAENGGSLNFPKKPNHKGGFGDYSVRTTIKFRNQDYQSVSSVPNLRADFGDGCGHCGT